MGAGAYLASKSNREVYESEIEREQTEIEEDPHEEMLELELFYQLKGFSPGRFWMSPEKTSDRSPRSELALNCTSRHESTSDARAFIQSSRRSRASPIASSGVISTRANRIESVRA